MEKLALLSASDKRGLVEFATALVNRFGYRLLSTGGTAKLLAERGLPVTEVSQHTGFPEIMDGRVKTLHPKIHGGLLCRRDKPDHLRQAEVNGIALIDLVVVNLYPFEETVARRESTSKRPLRISISVPSMLRSAAKNHESVTVVCDPADYQPCCRRWNRPRRCLGPAPPRAQGFSADRKLRRGDLPVSRGTAGRAGSRCGGRIPVFAHPDV